MKTKLLLPILLALFATSAFSQSYEPFINFDKYWDIYEQRNCMDETGYRYYIDDSTFTLDGKIAYHIVSHLPHYQGSENLSWIISEDTLLQQIYLYHYGQGGWKPLYDFSLQIGDSTVLTVFPIMTDTFYVTQIDTIIHPNQTKTPRWHVRQVSNSFDFTYTRDFGNIETAFFSPFYGLGGGYVTLCYGMYGDSALEANCTGKTLNHVEQEMLQITLYPNPASHAFTLNLENANTLAAQTLQVEIYNMQGQRCLHQTLAGGPTHQSINVEALPVGLYFVEIKNQSGKALWREKLMIE